MPRSRLSLALLLAFAAPARASIYIVRHAEKAQTGEDLSRPLTEAGRKRANDLARALRSVKLKAVFVTEFLRSRQTGAPAAAQAGLKPRRYDAQNTAGLVTALEQFKPQDDVLVVAHSDTIPEALKKLNVDGGPSDELAATDYDNLFVVDFGTTTSRLHWLHFGEPNP